MLITHSILPYFYLNFLQLKNKQTKQKTKTKTKQKTKQNKKKNTYVFNFLTVFTFYKYHYHLNHFFKNTLLLKNIGYCFSIQCFRAWFFNIYEHFFPKFTQSNSRCSPMVWVYSSTPYFSYYNPKISASNSLYFGSYNRKYTYTISGIPNLIFFWIFLIIHPNVI